MAVDQVDAPTTGPQWTARRLSAGGPPRGPIPRGTPEQRRALTVTLPRPAELATAAASGLAWCQAPGEWQVGVRTRARGDQASLAHRSPSCVVGGHPCESEMLPAGGVPLSGAALDAATSRRRWREVALCTGPSAGWCAGAAICVNTVKRLLRNDRRNYEQVFVGDGAADFGCPSSRLSARAKIAEGRTPRASASLKTVVVVGVLVARSMWPT